MNPCMHTGVCAGIYMLNCHVGMYDNSVSYKCPEHACSNLCCWAQTSNPRRRLIFMVAILTNISRYACFTHAAMPYE